MTPEFSRPVDVRHLGERHMTLRADANERAALARRFGLLALDLLEAELALVRNGEVVTAQGRLNAAVIQSCAVSGEPLAVAIDEDIDLRFVPVAAQAHPEGEIELDAEGCDEIEYIGSTVDLGEAAAQTLALAIDPYATGPEAEAARAEHGLVDEAAVGPFAALAALRKSN